MESTDTPASPHIVTPITTTTTSFWVDIFLRLLVFATTLASILVMVTSNQTVLVPVQGLPAPATVSAKFSDSPAFIYFVVAVAVASLHFFLTMFTTFQVIYTGCCTVHFFLIRAWVDVLMLVLVATSVGAAAAVAYIGLEGNKHTQWDKICNTYGKFCQHLEGAVGLSLVGCIGIVLIVNLYFRSLFLRATRQGSRSRRPAYE